MRALWGERVARVERPANDPLGIVTGGCTTGRTMNGPSGGRVQACCFSGSFIAIGAAAGVSSRGARNPVIRWVVAAWASSSRLGRDGPSAGRKTEKVEPLPGEERTLLLAFLGSS